MPTVARLVAWGCALAPLLAPIAAGGCKPDDAPKSGSVQAPNAEPVAVAPPTDSSRVLRQSVERHSEPAYRLPDYDEAVAEKRQAWLEARARAEAEAEAKNEANRQAYEAVVARLTQGYEKRQEKYEADKAAYEKAMPVYEIAKADFDAEKKLAEARIWDDASYRRGASKLFREFAQRRFREIIEHYPDTQAAKDAKVLLRDGTVAERKMPPEPIPPVMPVKPAPLVLPRPPDLVAVEFPPIPVEAALAQVPTSTVRLSC